MTARSRRVLACGLALAGAAAVAAPGAAERGLGFAPDEQHTAFPFAPPGFADVPSTAPSWDGRTAAFDLLEGARAGRIRCAVDADGRVDCPAVAQAEAAARALLLRLAPHWQAAGEDAVVPPADLAAALDGTPWAPLVLAACGGDACPLPAVLEATRFLRVTPAQVAAMDADGDGWVSRDEHRGAPRLATHLLGTDGLGRDAFVRLLHGLRTSLGVGALAALVAALIGVAWGTAAGLLGGVAGGLMMRAVDVLYGLPFLFLVILLISLVGPSTANLLVAIACVQWLSMARTVRALTVSLIQAPFVEQARIQGCGPLRLAATHLVPNARGPILAWTALLVPASIKEEAFLSFLGLGVQAPGASLGTLIADGAPRIAEYPWLVAAPAAVLFLIVLGVTAAADRG